MYISRTRLVKGENDLHGERDICNEKYGRRHANDLEVGYPTVCRLLCHLGCGSNGPIQVGMILKYPPRSELPDVFWGWRHTSGPRFVGGQSQIEPSASLTVPLSPVR
jgi:hypothetical protein